MKKFYNLGGCFLTTRFDGVDLGPELQCLLKVKECLI